MTEELFGFAKLAEEYPDFETNPPSKERMLQAAHE